MTAQLVKPINETTTHIIADKSIADIVAPSQTAMVYGFGHCKYTLVDGALSKKIDRVYDCSLGNDVNPIDPAQLHKHQRIGPNRTMIHKINSGSSAPGSNPNGKRIYKAGLVNQVLENYEKEKLGVSITPIIFCIDLGVSTEDSQGNPYPLTSENLLSKTKEEHGLKMNDIITHSEIRRAYKLCFDPKVDSRIQAVAKRTFKFVRVTRDRTQVDIERPNEIDRQVQLKYSLEKIPAPWEALDFQTELTRRKAYATQHPVQRQPKPDWRVQVNAFCAKDPLPSKGTSLSTVAKTIATLGVLTLATYGMFLAKSYFG